MTLNNGSGFLASYNQDIYRTSSLNSSLLLGMEPGRRFEFKNAGRQIASITELI